jgi:hypothetical protein
MHHENLHAVGCLPHTADAVREVFNKSFSDPNDPPVNDVNVLSHFGGWSGTPQGSSAGCRRRIEQLEATSPKSMPFFCMENCNSHGHA